MITEEAIQEAMGEINIPSLVDYLDDSDELIDLLYCICYENDYGVGVWLDELKAKAKAKKYSMAADLAIEKDLNSQVNWYSDKPIYLTQKEKT